MEKKRIWFALLPILIVLTTTGWSKDAEVKVGDVPPDYLGRDADDEEVHAAAHHGKVVIISFFATWCGACRKEVPVLAELQREAGRDKLFVVAIDLQETRKVVAKMRKLFKDYGITFTHDFNGRIAERFGVQGIPHMVIIGRDGRVAAKHVGYSESNLDAVIDDINRIWRQTGPRPSNKASAPRK